MPAKSNLYPLGKSFDQTLQEGCTNGPKASRNELNSSTSFLIRGKCKLKPQGNIHYLTPTRSTAAERVGEGVEQLLARCCWEHAQCNHLENCLAETFKVKCAPTSNSASRCLPKRSEDACPQVDIYKSVRSSFMHNAREMGISKRPPGSPGE